MPLYLGLGMAGVAALALLVALIARSWLWFGIAVAEAHAAALFVAVGLIADQVRLTAERTRGTPLVIEAERLNFPSS